MKNLANYLSNVEDLESYLQNISSISRPQFIEILLNIGKNHNLSEIVQNLKAHNVLAPLPKDFWLTCAFYVNQNLLYSTFEYHHSAAPLQRIFDFDSAWRFMNPFMPFEKIVEKFCMCTEGTSLDFGQF